MGCSILVALDESKNALRAVDFVCRHFTPDHRITFMSVVPDTAALCNMNSPSLIPYFKSQQGAFCDLEDKKREIVRTVMEQAKERLVRSGFAEENLTLKMETQQEGVARDILAEAQRGYEVIVVGRRGMSEVREFFMGSVSQKILHNAGGIPVVLVG
jgi:nucleotide-binding universal stress UspA family protein